MLPHPHLRRRIRPHLPLPIRWGEGRGEGPGGGASSSQIKNQKSKIKNILILNPDHFQHIIEDHTLLGWRYTGLGRNSPLESQVFLPEEVWFEKLPNPFDFWRGMSPLR